MSYFILSFVLLCTFNTISTITAQEIPGHHFGNSIINEIELLRSPRKKAKKLKVKKKRERKEGKKERLEQQRKRKVYLILRSRNNAGMFSMFDDVFDAINRYEEGSVTGVTVDFGLEGLYFDHEHGDNWWTYYCHPIELGTKLSTVREETLGHRLTKKTLEMLSSDRQGVYAFIKKHIRINEPILKKINNFSLKNFTGKFVLAVHYRGTDKYTEAPQVAYQDVANEILIVLQDIKNRPYTIFLATDEQAFIDYMKELFGENICYNQDALRSKDGTPIHFDPSFNHYQCGEDALIDCVLLSKGDYLIRCSSNLSRWSTYFNPTIPVHKMNEQFNGRHAYLVND